MGLLYLHISTSQNVGMGRKSVLRNVPEEGRSHFHRGESLNYSWAVSSLVALFYNDSVL